MVTPVIIQSFIVFSVSSVSVNPCKYVLSTIHLFGRTLRLLCNSSRFIISKIILNRPFILPANVPLYPPASAKNFNYFPPTLNHCSLNYIQSSDSVFALMHFSVTTASIKPSVSAMMYAVYYLLSFCPRQTLYPRYFQAYSLPIELSIIPTLGSSCLPCFFLTFSTSMLPCICSITRSPLPC